MKQIRQGDILLSPISELPKGLKLKDKVLALGEATGHSHRFEDDDDTVLVHVNSGGKQYVEVLKPTTLKHQEHGDIPVLEGLYELRQQREFDATADIGKQTRTVVD